MTIQQQCYTRTQKGLFRKSEGYDTVAYSEGLTENFIKKWLHPFCYYQPSRLLQAKRVPAEQFPRGIKIIQLPDGLMLIGQTVYVESDFTGQRSTFFTHNYVLPRPESLTSEVIGDLLYRTNFLIESEWEQLPELNDLPFTKDKTPAVGPLPFDKKQLMQLLYVLLEAISGFRKVYVILPDLDWVNPMVMWLYGQLPESAKQLLGFTTYSRELENKKLLHLIFMERGSFQVGEIKLESDYIFDFEDGYFSENLPEVTAELLKEKSENFAILEEEDDNEETSAPAKEIGLTAAIKRFLKR